MPKFSEFWLAYLAQAFATIGLLWTAANAIRARSHEAKLAEAKRVHDKELAAAQQVHHEQLEHLRTELRREVEHGLLAAESRLRVATELRLRLHQESWKLLREIQEATFQTFEAIRTYAVDVAYSSTNGDPPELKRKATNSYQVALAAVMRTSGLCRCAPPEQKAFRQASSAFAQAFNDTNANALSGDTKPEWLGQTMVALNEAMKVTASATNEWNATLWRENDDAVAALAARPAPIAPTEVTQSPGHVVHRARSKRSFEPCEMN